MVVKCYFNNRDKVICKTIFRSVLRFYFKENIYSFATTSNTNSNEKRFAYF